MAAIGERTPLGCLAAGQVREAIVTVVTAEVGELACSTDYRHSVHGVPESFFSRPSMWARSRLSAHFSRVFTPIAHRVLLRMAMSRFVHERLRSAESPR